MTRSSWLRAFVSAALAFAAVVPGGRVAHAQDHDRMEQDQPPRWRGDGSLKPATSQSSEDGRFALAARLHEPATRAPTDATRRFALSAQLAAPRGVAGSCAASGDRIFSDGFEEQP